MLSKHDYKKLHFLIQVAFVAVFVFVAFLLFRYIFGVIAPFIIAFIAASLVEPLVRLLTQKLRFPRSIASTICVILLLAVIVAIGAFLSTTIWSEGKDLIAGFPDHVRSIISSVKSNLNDRNGIFSMFSSAASRYITGAKRKLPFAIFTVRISPAKS